MPKVKKIRSAALEAQKARHEPLGQVIEDDSNRRKFVSQSSRPVTRANKSGDDRNDTMLDVSTSQRILKLSQVQQLEIEQERANQRRSKMSSDEPKDDSDDDIGEVPGELMIEEDDDDECMIQQEGGYVTIVDEATGLTAAEEAIVAAMRNGEEQSRSLGDIIMQKIQEKQQQSIGKDEEDNEMELPPKVLQVYTDIGKILSRYTSGKLPKAFKVIPSLSNWEEVLYLTRPDLWTPQAMYAATRIFASNLNPKMAQRFYNLVLLDAVRADCQANKKLNYHYYMALKKSVYKPAAFFKGILLPLAQQNCTLREAAIVSSALTRVSIPVHHSAVAIHKLAQAKEYSGASSIFIKTLLNKKYSLPAPVIGSLVRHFANFESDDRQLPVLWHQALLVFCQRYKMEVREHARESLRRVMKIHFHSKITPEIRRELFGAQAFRDERQAIQGIDDMCGDSKTTDMVQ